jgi:hypothetical protein
MIKAMRALLFPGLLVIALVLVVILVLQYRRAKRRGQVTSPLPETKAFIELQKRSKERKILSGTTITGT